MLPFVDRRGSRLAEPVVRRIAGCVLPNLLCALLVCSAAAQKRSPAPDDSGQSGPSELAIRGVLVPTGFQGRAYTAMIQIAVDGSPLADATWDLGASLISNERQQENYSGRVLAKEPGTPVVLEIPVELNPGPYTLTLAARETTAGQSGTLRFDGHWPDPHGLPATVSPVALLQPARGVFLRGEQVRTQGALALGDDDPIRTHLPVAIVSVVCRGETLTDPLHVEREIEGLASADFETIQLPPGQDRCAQVRDMIEPGTLREGHFKYKIRLTTGNGEIGSGEREFSTAGATRLPGGRSAPPENGAGS
jgi:hypothetical protein